MIDSMEADKIKVSIIVLTYKRFDGIQKNIESIMSQRFESYEIIISDDGSPNFDKQYIEALLANAGNKRPYTVITRAENVGTVKNYNNAVKAAKGDIIVPLSQDDCFYSEDSLSRIVEAFEDDETNIVLGLRCGVDQKKPLPGDYQREIIKENNRKKLWFRNACRNMFYGAALYIRKEYLSGKGFFDESYNLLEDYPFIMFAIEQGERIEVIDTPTVMYGVEGVSTGGFRIAPERLVKDQIRLRTILCDKSCEKIHSRLGRRYLEYLLCMWKNANKRVFLQRFRFPVINLVIWVTKLVATIKKEDVWDCRFKLLWRIETRASR